jgi:ribosome-associated translation inhibitor RaiA
LPFFFFFAGQNFCHSFKTENMKISIHTSGIKGSRQLLEYLNRKVNEFSGQSKIGVTEAEVRLRFSKSLSLDDKVCEIYVKLPGKNIFASQTGRTFEDAARRALEKLTRQIDAIHMVSDGTAPPSTTPEIQTTT